ncbi:helix-turn-helix domain-containing protein [Antrihabitans stalactiti]|uniref:Sigma-54 factor interaction domain-containing protein n=1 Tax=Antrihabitans stalactiti TaxID=2584121 RepID=A0A848K421_9NOCA|nr:helix-turn-helix domain-containing protein [Antrihabitans stalactiti]NMN93885.1 hypothetical protein [Antrihabitans stalactiti]
MTAATNVLDLAQHRTIMDNRSAETAGRDMVLAQAFVRASRAPGTEVVAVNERLLMSTSAAARCLGAVDQAALWRWARECSSARVAMLPLGGRAPLKTELVPIFDATVRVGVLVTLDLSRPHPLHCVSQHEERLFVSVLPGTSRQASQLRADVARASDVDANILITGEQGTGKGTVARRILDLVGDRGNTIDEFDAHDAEQDGWTDRVAAALCHGHVLVTHFDTLPDSGRSTLLTAAAHSLRGRLVATAEYSNVAGPNDREFSFRITLPPLRDRLEDLPAIATQVLARKIVNGKGKRLTAGVRRHLWRYSWPGNITELEVVLSRAVLRAPTAVIDEFCIQLPAGIEAGLGAHRRSLVESAELDVLRDALDRCGGNKLAAADMLGISRSTLYRKVRALGI